jgi:hypothetical protein
MRYRQLDRIDAAKDPTTPVEKLVILAEDLAWYVRRAVAENPSTPEAVKLWMKLQERGGYAGMSLKEFMKSMKG